HRAGNLLEDNRLVLALDGHGILLVFDRCFGAARDNEPAGAIDLLANDSSDRCAVDVNVEDVQKYADFPAGLSIELSLSKIEDGPTGGRDHATAEGRDTSRVTEKIEDESGQIPERQRPADPRQVCDTDPESNQREPVQNAVQNHSCP